MPQRHHKCRISKRGDTTDDILVILDTFRVTLWGNEVSFLLPVHLSWAIEETSYFRAGQNGEGK